VWFWETPTWNWAEFWAVLILLVPSGLALLGQGLGHAKARFFLGLVNGKDGRWSTSKTTVLLWTYAVWFAFIAILLHTNGAGLANAVLHQQYLVLLGIPLAAAVTAKGIVQSKTDAGVLTKPVADPQTDPISG